MGAEVMPVTVDASGMKRGGKPYFIKGAGGDTMIPAMVAAGANSLRLWGQDQFGGAFPVAEQYGLTISAGIWLESECSWFSYHNPEHCKKQTQRVRELILEYRGNPALLSWGLGNEMEGDGKNAALWQQVDQLAQLVHELDPAHPTFTAVAGMNADKAAGMNQHAPHLDYVGVNTYAALPGLRTDLERMEWKRPYVVTEFGAPGFWERPKTPWGAGFEQTSTEKAGFVRSAYEKSIAPGGACLGSYVFVWGQKQEASATWFGLHTLAGESTALLDVMQEMWTGKAPANQAPAITALTSTQAGQVLAPGASVMASIVATDPEGDALFYRWQIANDVTQRNAVGQELPCAILPLSIPSKAEVKFSAPAQPGNYRVMAYVLDGKGHAATANFPVQVK